MWQICSINMTNLWGQTCNSGNNVCPIPVRVLIGFNNGNKDGVAHVAGFSDLVDPGSPLGQPWVPDFWGATVGLQKIRLRWVPVALC